MAFENIKAESVFVNGDKQRTNKQGRCFKTCPSSKVSHYILFREKDMLHIGNHPEFYTSLMIGITNIDDVGDDFRHWEEITREEFNDALNNAIFEMSIYVEEYKNNALQLKNLAGFCQLELMTDEQLKEEERVLTVEIEAAEHRLNCVEN